MHKDTIFQMGTSRKVAIWKTKNEGEGQYYFGPVLWPVMGLLISC